MAAGVAGRLARIALFLLAAWLIGPPVADAAAADGGNGLKLPRFASLRSDEVNLRVGPGRNYPIEWVLTRKEMPVEIVREFEHWRMVRDWQGTEGWVQERLLSGRRAVIVTGGTQPLYRGPDAGSGLVARAEAGVVARLLECRSVWCRIEAGGYKGWVERRQVWGILPDESLK
jgi:SH3-like domain-containing protein